MSTVIVTGGRDYHQYEPVGLTLDLIKPDLVVQGGASGADSSARYWAKKNNVSCKSYPAQWDIYGKRAGPIRNREMLVNHPQAVVVVFPGGKGTENCIQQARQLGHLILKFI